MVNLLIYIIISKNVLVHNIYGSKYVLYKEVKYKSLGNELGNIQVLYMQSDSVSSCFIHLVYQINFVSLCPKSFDIYTHGES